MVIQTKIRIRASCLKCWLATYVLDLRPEHISLYDHTHRSRYSRIRNPKCRLLAWKVIEYEKTHDVYTVGE